MSVLESLDRNMPILVVDDFATMRKIVRNCLRQLGFSNIQDADSGEAALEILDSGEFQFVICDWYMPGMSGLDLLEVMKEDPRLKPVAFLMVTADAQREKVEQAAQKQGFSYIIKPFTSDVLQSKLGELFTNGHPKPASPESSPKAMPSRPDGMN